MDAAAIFGILEKGLSLIPILMEVGGEVVPLVQRMQQVAADAKAGKQIDPTELDTLEKDLDMALADFNQPMDP